MILLPNRESYQKTRFPFEKVKLKGAQGYPWLQAAKPYLNRRKRKLFDFSFRNFQSSVQAVVNIYYSKWLAGSFGFYQFESWKILMTTPICMYIHTIRSLDAPVPSPLNSMNYVQKKPCGRPAQLCPLQRTLILQKHTLTTVVLITREPLRQFNFEEEGDDHSAQAFRVLTVDKSFTSRPNNQRVSN